MLRRVSGGGGCRAPLESAAAQAKDPAAGRAQHRYYMDESRELYLLFHTAGRRLVCRGEVTEQAKRVVPPHLDPFSGTH